VIYILRYTLKFFVTLTTYFRFGSVARFLIPSSKALALVDYVEPSEARLAFNGLAYRKYKHLPLYIEWAPLDVITKKKVSSAIGSSSNRSSKGKEYEEGGIEDEGGGGGGGGGGEGVDLSIAIENDSQFGSLFIKNLNFSSTEEGIRAHMQKLGCKPMLLIMFVFDTRSLKRLFILLFNSLKRFVC